MSVFSLKKDAEHLSAQERRRKIIERLAWLILAAAIATLVLAIVLNLPASPH